MSIRSLWQTVKREGLREIAVEAIRSWLWSPLASLLVFVIGMFERIPITYLLTAAALVFAAVSVGLLRFNEWIARQRVEHKLVFEKPELKKNLNDRGETEWIQIMGVFSNKADFPIEFDLEFINTNMADNYPPKKPHTETKTIVQPHMPGYIVDHPISFPKPIRSKAATGNMEFRVKYGRPGKLKYIIETKLTLAALFDDSGDVGSFQWFGK